MLPEIISFNKSMEYRLQEYQQLFSSVETPCSEIIDIWASVFEDLVIENLDWSALWILSEENCKKFNLLFPTAVIVNVNDFDWKNLTAEVKVLAVQEDIILPSELSVPIIELHPIKAQDYDEIVLRDIEDWFDKCRYFFRNLWYPWDAKFDVSLMDWCEAHLKNRLKMNYDIKSGIFGKAITNYLKSLIAEAQNINCISDSNTEPNVDERLAVVKKYIRKKIVKTELDLFEEPYLRYGMILLKKKEKYLKECSDSVENKVARIVWTGGNCESLIQFLNISQSRIEKEIPVKLYKSFQEALDASNAEDVILLPSGVHVMNSLNGIGNGGMIKGLSITESIIMSDMSTIPRAILFECFGFMEIENLTLSKPSGIIIQIFSGTVKISNCKIYSKNDSTSKGIVVISGCKLFLENCELHGFGTGITLQPGTYASISNTKIFDCHEGIKVLGDASLSIHQVEISSCSSFGMRIESPEIDLETSLIGDLDLLEQTSVNCKVTYNGLTFNNNKKKGNIIISKSEKVFAIEDTFESNISDEVICISDTDDSFIDKDDIQNTF